MLLSFLGESWSHELVPSREEAVRRLVESVSFTTPERAGDFLNLQRSPHELAPSSPLRALLDAWSECAGQYDRGRLDRLLREALKGRFVLFEANAGAPYVQVKDVGEGLSMSASYWLSRTKGLRVEDQPDYAYGKWVAESYRQVLRTGEPSLEDVDAIIQWPQQPRMSYRYRRLVVPFQNGPSSTLLLSATVIDPDICLRGRSG